MTVEGTHGRGHEEDGNEGKARGKKQIKYLASTCGLMQTWTGNIPLCQKKFMQAHAIMIWIMVNLFPLLIANFHSLNPFYMPPQIYVLCIVLYFLPYSTALNNFRPS